MIEGLKPYPAYKDSGVPWLGKVPAHWDFGTLRRKLRASDGIKIGESPAGKAIKFLHRGSYDDIDSTYDLITAFLDEKGLESQNRFIEEYLTDTTEPVDANLEADIYVFIK